MDRVSKDLSHDKTLSIKNKSNRSENTKIKSMTQTANRKSNTNKIKINKTQLNKECTTYIMNATIATNKVSSDNYIYSQTSPKLDTFPNSKPRSKLKENEAKCIYFYIIISQIFNILMTKFLILLLKSEI